MACLPACLPRWVHSAQKRVVFSLDSHKLAHVSGRVYRATLIMLTRASRGSTNEGSNEVRGDSTLSCPQCVAVLHAEAEGRHSLRFW
jgi:hypothetical protein